MQPVPRVVENKYDFGGYTSRPTVSDLSQVN
jgi:hypothetical protein